MRLLAVVIALWSASAHAEDVERAAGAQLERTMSVAWDPGRDDLRTTLTVRLDGLVLSSADLPAPPGPRTTVQSPLVWSADPERARAWTDEYLFTIIRHGGDVLGRPGMPALSVLNERSE